MSYEASDQTTSVNEPQGNKPQKNKSLVNERYSDVMFIEQAYLSLKTDI